MLKLAATGLRVEDGTLHVLDQTRLPSETHWLTCETADELAAAIRALRIRGAPMIAIGAALMAAVHAERGDDRAHVAAALDTLEAARPTAVDLAHAMRRLRDTLDAPDWRERLVAEAVSIFERDRALCEAIAEHGAALIEPGQRLLTHCNTGGLATAGIGTAFGVLRRAHEQGKDISVWVGETRPLLQGGRLTAWELAQLGVPYRLLTDSTAASLMAAGEVDAVIVGADRIADNGDFANKIGTYGLAVLARYHDIPFYVAAPHTTVDPTCASGADIPIEQRDADEVRGLAGPPQPVRWSPADAPAHNPAFDVTPAGLVSAWILDTGVYRAEDVAEGVFSNPS